MQPPTLKYIRRLAVAGATCKMAAARCVAGPSERCNACTYSLQAGHHQLCVCSCEFLCTHAARELVCSMLRPPPGSAQDVNYFQAPAAHWAQAPQLRRILLRNSADVSLVHGVIGACAASCLHKTYSGRPAEVFIQHIGLLLLFSTAVLCITLRTYLQSAG